MSEAAARYTVNRKSPITPSALKKRACSKPFSDSRFKPPSAEEINSVIAIGQWTQVDVAYIIGISSSEKGSATLRRWKSDPESPSHRQIPYAAWRLMLIEAEVITQGVMLPSTC